jgi:hypothetical protein
MLRGFITADVDIRVPVITADVDIRVPVIF